MRFSICALVFVVLPFCATPFVARADETASRVPLLVVPESARRDLRINPSPHQLADPSGERAVGAVPGTTSGIVQLGTIGALADTDIGLTRGLGPDIWKGARQVSAARALRRLPFPVRYASLRALEKQILNTRAPAPLGSSERVSFLAERINRLLIGGDNAGALQLIAQSEADRQDAQILRLKWTAMVLSGDTASACAPEENTETQTPTSDEVVAPTLNESMRHYQDEQIFFTKFRIYCLLFNGLKDQAALALDLAREKLERHKLFIDTAFLLAADAEVPSLPERINPPDFADYLIVKMARQQLPLFAESYPPYLMLALAEDKRQSALIRLGAARRALIAERIGAPRFITISEEVATARAAIRPSPIDENTEAPAIEDIDPIQRDPTLATMAFRLRAITENAPLATRAVAIREALLAAITADKWWVMAVALRDVMRRFPRNDQTREAALCLVPVALYANDFDRAQSWLEQATRIRNDQIRSARTTLYRAISYWRNEAGENRFADDMDWEVWRAEWDENLPGQRSYLRAEAGVWLGVSAAEVPEGVLTLIGLAPPSLRARRVLEFSGRRGLGELALSMIAEYGDAPLSEMTPADIAAITAHLRRFGLDKTADDFASEYLAEHFAIWARRLELNQ